MLTNSSGKGILGAGRPSVSGVAVGPGLHGVSSPCPSPPSWPRACRLFDLDTSRGAKNSPAAIASSSKVFDVPAKRLGRWPVCGKNAGQQEGPWPVCGDRGSGSDSPRSPVRGPEDFGSAGPPDCRSLDLAGPSGPSQMRSGAHRRIVECHRGPQIDRRVAGDVPRTWSSSRPGRGSDILPTRVPEPSLQHFWPPRFCGIEAPVGGTWTKNPPAGRPSNFKTIPSEASPGLRRIIGTPRCWAYPRR